MSWMEKKTWKTPAVTFPFVPTPITNTTKAWMISVELRSQAITFSAILNSLHLVSGVLPLLFSQLYLCSISPPAAQPSPPVTLPKSHSSGDTTIPSPKTTLQLVPLASQDHPDSISQFEAQPSPELSFPSSQSSQTCLVPSPQFY